MGISHFEKRERGPVKGYVCGHLVYTLCVYYFIGIFFYLHQKQIMSSKVPLSQRGPRSYLLFRLFLFVKILLSHRARIRKHTPTNE